MKFKKMTWGIAALLLLTCLPAVARAQKAVDVRHTRIVIPGFVEPNTPGAPGVAVDPKLAAAVTDPAAFNPDGSLNLNKAIYVRFFDINRKSAPKTILILIPELESGAGSLGVPATEIVKKTNGKTEVWIIDRRANLLEDLRPIVDAWNQKSVAASLTALRGYMENPAGRGGFLANNPHVLSSFMTEWGLDVHLRDVRAVVEKARKVTPNVFLGGHSLGATMTQMFAAYDFGDTPGFKLIKGMVLVEPTLDPLAATPITDEVYFEGNTRIPGLNKIRNQYTEYPPFFADGYGFGIVTAVLFQIYDLGVQISALDPHGTQLYESGYMNSVLKYPATNQVCMAINMDDEFQFQPIARVSVGFLKVPPGKTINDVATRVRDDPTGVNPNGVWVPKDPGPGNVLEWEYKSDLSALGPELTGKEINRIENIIQQKLPLTDTAGPNIGGGGVDTLEWFLPIRLRLDVRKVQDLGRTPLSEEVIAAQKARGGNPLTVTKNDRVNKAALFIRAASGGFIKSDAGYLRYALSTSIARNKVSIATLDDYCHTDVLSSLERTASSRDGKKMEKNLPELIVDFMNDNR